MIRRPYQDGYLLISQPAHAWLSGQLAQHWGNERISSPEPYQTIVLATTMHDNGWHEKEGIPILNAEMQPLDFLGPELDKVKGVYKRCVTQMMQVDPYAAILVNRHIQTIYHSRAVHKRDPIERLQPLLDDLKMQELSTIQNLKTHPVYHNYLDADTLDHNYRILRTCDLLSLFVCGAFPARSVDEIPFTYGEPRGKVNCVMLDEHTLQVSPNLFNQAEITVYLQARVIPQRTFSSEAEYQEVFENAEFITLKKTIVGV